MKSINGIQLLNVSKCALGDYKKSTRKGVLYSDLDIAKRLTRHYILGDIVHNEGYISTFRFGNMDIIIDTKTSVVITCRNYKGKNNTYKINGLLKKELGRQLEIDEVRIDNIWNLVKVHSGVQV